MGFENYISESEAALLAGVSVNTLQRFAEAGYLGIEADSDGLQLFSKREIADVFGITDESLVLNSDPSEKTSSLSNGKNDTREVELSSPANAQPHFARTTEVKDLSFKPVSTYCPEISETREEAHQVNESTHPKLKREASDTRESASIAAADREKSHENQIVVRLEQDVRRLKSALDLQEKLLDIREGEISSLKSERDWLRIRIERLEEKGDRDQLLLLSETQVLRQLLTQREYERRRSPLRAALEWVGLVEPQKQDTTPLTRTGTIDHPSKS